MTTKRDSTVRSHRLLPWLVCSIVLLVLAIAPRNHAVICLARLGLVQGVDLAAVETTAPHCSCCDAADESAPARGEEPGEERAGACCPHGCCVDLQADVQLGPLPRAELPAPPDLVAVAPMAAEALVASRDRGGSVWAFDTGPPRTDARAALRATVVLRL